MKTYLEYRDLYVKDSKNPSGLLLKKAPFIWTEEVVDQIQGREFEFHQPNLKIKWISEFIDLDWSKFQGKNLKPIISYLNRCLQWAKQNGLSNLEKKSLIRREFQNFYSKIRYPFDPLSKYFNYTLESDE